MLKILLPEQLVFLNTEKEEALNNLPWKARERAIVSQTNIRTVSKATLGKLLRDGVERTWTFPSAQIPPWSELNWSELAFVQWGLLRMFDIVSPRFILETRLACKDHFEVYNYKDLALHFGTRSLILLAYAWYTTILLCDFCGAAVLFFQQASQALGRFWLQVYLVPHLEKPWLRLWSEQRLVSLVWVTTFQASCTESAR